MKALDTNILARYLRDDDPVQSRRAAHFIQRAVRLGKPLYVNHVVLCELAWILTSVYEHSKDEIVDMMENILRTGHFELEDKPSIESALEDYSLSIGLNNARKRGARQSLLWNGQHGRNISIPRSGPPARVVPLL